MLYCSAMNDTAKRIISALIFGAGLLFSLYGCAVSAGAIFSIGANDSFAEIVAIVVCLPGFFAATILAFWFRKIAGIAMMTLSSIFLTGMLLQRNYELTALHLSHENLPTFLAAILRPCVPVFLLGAFALISGLAGWQEVIQRKRESIE
jgi:hypothetical protein